VDAELPTRFASFAFLGVPGADLTRLDRGVLGHDRGAHLDLDLLHALREAVQFAPLFVGEVVHVQELLHPLPRKIIIACKGTVSKPGERENPSRPTRAGICDLPRGELL
jgi:hypothetical protein